jgi:uncharacterized protein (DUF2252 family)
MASPSPEALAVRQVAIDRERTRRFPSLLARKQRRMSASPFAFLRGAAPLFYEIIGQAPELGEGPDGEGWIVGDLHLENFGAYGPARPASAAVDKRAAEFNLNDFDDAVRGPWRWDLLRLLTSLILAGRELGVSGPVALELATRLLDSYVAAAFRGAPVPAPLPPVSALVERMRSRSRQELLDARTVIEAGRRRFVRGERYLELPSEIVSELPAAVETYLAQLSPDERPRPEQLEIVDAAHRIAGTGSLGMLRVALLVRGKGGNDGQWIFDMKEQSAPSAAGLVIGSSLSPAERVVTAFRASVDPPPRLLGTSRIGTCDVFVRRATPQEDKLDLGQLKAETLGSLALYLGALVGAAHARAVEQKLPEPWSGRECSELVRRAARMASLHEAIYLEWCFALRTSAASGERSPPR